MLDDISKSKINWLGNFKSLFKLWIVRVKRNPWRKCFIHNICKNWVFSLSARSSNFISIGEKSNVIKANVLCLSIKSLKWWSSIETNNCICFIIYWSRIIEVGCGRRGRYFNIWSFSNYICRSKGSKVAEFNYAVWLKSTIYFWKCKCMNISRFSEKTKKLWLIWHISLWGKSTSCSKSIWRS